MTALALAGLALAACGTSEPFPTESDRPPDLVFTAGTEHVVLIPFSYCWSRVVGPDETLNVCADGVPPDPLQQLTLAEGTPISAEFRLPWDLRVHFGPEDIVGQRRLAIDLDPSGVSFTPTLSTGTYLIEVTGQGEEGDAVWAFEVRVISG